MFKFLLGFFFLFGYYTQPLYASYCKAVVIAVDFKDGFKNKGHAFDYCLSVVNAYDAWTPDWKSQFCKSQSYKYNGYEYFSIRINIPLSKYDAQYQESIFYALMDDYKYIAYGRRDYPEVKIQINFSGYCSSYDY